MDGENHLDRNLTMETCYLKQLLAYYYPLHFFALFRAHELYNVAPYIEALSPPILDLGCGDGMITDMLFGCALDYGIDVSRSAVRRAKERGSYKMVFCTDAHHIPLESGSLGGVFSNCVLEHIPDMPALIKEVSRLLRPGAYFVTTCLSPFYYTMNPVFKMFDKPLLRWIRQKMISEENRLQNHVSVFGVEEYRRMFEDGGMVLEIQKYYATEALSRFSNKWDTASKYSIPFPIGLGHSGLLIKYLRLKYGKLSDQETMIRQWNHALSSICYDRNHSNQEGVAQILVARKVQEVPSK